mmetsp:Transcript_26574/g.71893  ORF Transcript_26574/g.71893 Transcript_26574/m.71893 type:complete len:240 (+) Transcript_26574:291-1010(+)
MVQLPSTPSPKRKMTFLEDGGDVSSCYPLPSAQGCGQVTPPHHDGAQNSKRRSRLGGGWHATARALLSTSAGFSLAAAEGLLQTGSHGQQPPGATTKRQEHSSSDTSSTGDSSTNSCLGGGHWTEKDEESEEEASAWVTLCVPSTPRCNATLTPNPFAAHAPAPSVSPCSLRASKVSIRSGKGGQPVARTVFVQPQLCSSPAAARTPPPSPSPSLPGAAPDSALLGCLCVHAPRPTLAC